MVISACGSQANATTTIDMPALQTVAFQTSIAGVKRTATADALTAMPKTTGTPSTFPAATVIPRTTALILAGSDVFYNGISFTVDPFLGDEVFVSVALEPPVYTRFAFALEGDCRQVGCVTVYQVEAFRDYPFGDDIMDELLAAIETGSFSYFPTWGSAILLRAQTQHIRFQNGAGIRATVMRAQMGYFANNQELVYDFHGLTDDGRYYVEVIFPIDAPMLLSTYDPVENTNKAAIPVPALPDDDPFGLVSNDVMRAYNQEAQRQLDVLESASFIPDLGYLDALVDSLLVTSSSGE